MSLVLVTGPPGAGKSTVCALLAERFEPSVLIEGDAFFGFLKRGAIEPWLPESRQQNMVVTHASAAAAGRFAAGGFHTVFDGMVGPWFVDEFMSATALERLDYVILLPSEDVCVERVATRPNHGFTDEPATRHMHNEFASASVDGRHVMVDPPDDPGAVADLVLGALDQGTFGYGRP